MNKKLIHKTDYLRVLLTDTLPYEVPYAFSNYYFHATLRKQKNDFPSELSDDLQKAATKFYIPYNYEISKPGGGLRTLSVPHPLIQYEVCQFYKKYDELLIELCKRSPYSIRRPVRVAAIYFEKNIKTFSQRDDSDESGETEEGVEQQPEPFHPQPETASSYFVYEQFNLVHKFFDSHDFINLEKRFRFLATFDISKCFYNIYTHTISWAVKSKEYAKSNIKNSSFEADFDKLMRRANYNETNGILVGPEISRIFAEILLQKVDLEIEAMLLKKNYINGKDYEIKRYVDDYFLFVNDEMIINEVTSLIHKRLEVYKLYLNVAKTHKANRPFLTPISISKIKTGKYAQEYFDSLYSNEREELSSYRKISRASLSFINNVRAVSVETGADFDAFSKYTISIVITKMTYLLGRVRGNVKSGEIVNAHFVHLCRKILDVLFYLYAMDCSVRSTYLVSRAIVYVIRICKDLSTEVLAETKRHAFDMTTNQLKYNSKHDSHASVESLNLLITLHHLGHEYNLSEEFLLELFHIRIDDKGVLISEETTLGYFQIVVLLYYIRDKTSYKQLKTAMNDYLMALFASFEIKRMLPISAEAYLLFLDLLSCPWLDKQVKKKLIGSYLMSKHEKIGNESKYTTKVNGILKFASRRLWYFDWGSDDYIEALLFKKELRTPY